MRERDQIDNFDGKLLAVSIGYALFLAWFSQAEVAVSSGRASGEVALLTNVALCVDLAALVLISCLSSLIGTLRNRKAVVTSLGVVLSVASIVHGVVSLGAVQGGCSGWATTALLGDAAAALTLVALIVVASTLLTTEDYVTTWGITPVDRQENSQTAIPTKADLYARLSRRYGLTRREEEVLALLADGASTADIERELVISNGTARNHIQHVYKKMGLRSRQQVQAFVSDELARALRNSRP